MTRCSATVAICILYALMMSPQVIVLLPQVTMKMVKQLGPYELPAMLAFMPDAERRAFMKRVRPRP